MRTLSAAATLRTLRPYAEPVYLLEIILTSTTLATLTLRYSDALRSLLGQEWAPGVVEWAAVASAMNAADVTGEPTSTEVTLLNTKPAGTKARLSALMRTPLNTSGTYEFAFAEAIIYQVFHDLAAENAAEDPYIEASCRIQDVTNITPERLTLVLSDLTLMIEDRSKLTTVTRDLFPSCSSADVGKKIPVVFNNPKGVRARCVVGGGFARLAAALTATAADGATTQLEDIGDETFPTGLHRIQIDGEAMTVRSRSTTTVTLGGRARADTLAVRHDAGSGVYEMRDGSKAYRYVVGEAPGGLRYRGVDGPLGALSGVKNVKSELGALTGVTVEHNATDLVAGKRFLVLNVPGVPKMPTQKPVSAEAGSERFTRTIQHLNGTLTMRVEVDGSPASGGVTVVASMPPLTGTEDSKNVNWEVTYRVEAAGPATSWFFQHSTPSIVDFGFGPLIAGGLWANVGRHIGERVATFGSGASYGSLAFRLELAAPGPIPAVATVTITSVKAIVEGVRRTSRAAQGKAPAPIGESTADVLFGAITCDVVGLEEDGAVTGRPGRLLSTPADIVKAILLYVYPGTTTADFGASFETTRALQVAADYTWTMVLEEPSFAVLRRKFGEQGQAALTYVGGLWEYTFLSTSPSAVDTIDESWGIRRDSVRISRTERTEIKNSLRVMSKPDFRLEGADRYRRVVIREDLTQEGLTATMQEDLVLDWVQTATMANALGDWRLGWKKRQRAKLDLTGWWNLLAFDPYDVLAFDNDGVLDDWGGTSLLFRVVGRRALLGDDNPGRIALSLVECNA